MFYYESLCGKMYNDVHVYRKRPTRRPTKACPVLCSSGAPYRDHDRSHALSPMFIPFQIFVVCTKLKKIINIPITLTLYTYIIYINDIYIYHIHMRISCLL